MSINLVKQVGKTGKKFTKSEKDSNHLKSEIYTFKEIKNDFRWFC